MYMASIVLTAWDSAMKASTAAAPAIDAAFAPAVRLHLLDAYGWQLLACNRVTGLPLKPPHCVATMPLLAEGIEVAPEVKEFQLLEAGGWLAELQKEIAPGLARQHRPMSWRLSARASTTLRRRTVSANLNT
jgi:hypothetical protein